MKRLILLLCAVLGLSACTPIPDAAYEQTAASASPVTASPSAATAAPSPDVPDPGLTVEVNGQTFAAELLDNPAAEAFRSLLPVTYTMQELNGNEKFCYLQDFRFPVDPEVPDMIRAGDICVYGDNCLVLFYEAHQTSYSYTRLGRLLDAEGLAAAAGGGDAAVSFALAGEAPPGSAAAEQPTP